MAGVEEEGKMIECNCTTFPEVVRILIFLFIMVVSCCILSCYWHFRYWKLRESVELPKDKVKYQKFVFDEEEK